MRKTVGWLGAGAVLAAVCWGAYAYVSGGSSLSDVSQQPPAAEAVSEQREPFAVRGVIEGFYGKPWTNEERKNMFAFMAKNHFNTYVYAPKDDPFQRSDWKDAYPADRLEEMRSLVQAAEQQGVSFVYSISPGIPQPLPNSLYPREATRKSITFTSEEDRAALKAKIAQMQSLGVRTIMLSFDDVKEELKKEDEAVYGDDYPRAHIELANRVYEEGKQADPQFQLWFAPTTYYGVKDNPYWKEIREKLHPEIQVIWTGEWVIAKNLHAGQAEKVAKLLGRKPLVWDNYPVNDFTYEVREKPQLFLGPLAMRAPNLYEQTAGLLANPMIQPEASKVALATVGAYLQDPEGYSPEQAWAAALAQVEGVGDGASFRKFAQYSRISEMDTKPSAEFQALADAYWKDFRQQPDGEAVRKMREEFTRLRDLPQTMQGDVTNQALLAEIAPWLNKLGVEGEAGLLALEYAALGPEDPKRPFAKRRLEDAMTDLQKDPLKIGDEVMSFLLKAKNL